MRGVRDALTEGQGLEGWAGQGKEQPQSAGDGWQRCSLSHAREEAHPAQYRFGGGRRQPDYPTGRGLPVLMAPRAVATLAMVLPVG